MVYNYQCKESSATAGFYFVGQDHENRPWQNNCCIEKEN